MIHHQDWSHHFSYSKWNKVYQISGRPQIHQLWQRWQSARPCSRLLWQPFGRPPWKQHRWSILESVLCWPLPLLALLLTELKDMKCKCVTFAFWWKHLVTHPQTSEDTQAAVPDSDLTPSADTDITEGRRTGDSNHSHRWLPLSINQHQNQKKILGITIFTYYY